MYGVDLYRRVRLACHRDGLSGREAARRFGIDRKTVAKILGHSVPPGYRRRQPPKRPKLDPFTDIIERILVEDGTVHRKQRHTAKRLPSPVRVRNRPANLTYRARDGPVTLRPQHNAMAGVRRCA